MKRTRMKGKLVSMPHPRGGTITGRIVSIDRTSSFARAYGAWVELDTGSSGPLSQCTLDLQQPHKRALGPQDSLDSTV